MSLTRHGTLEIKHMDPAWEAEVLRMFIPPTDFMFPVHDHFGFDYEGEPFNGYEHDPRCFDDCGHGGACQMVGMYCDQRCPGCNLYHVEQARERGLTPL